MVWEFVTGVAKVFSPVTTWIRWSVGSTFALIHRRRVRDERKLSGVVERVPVMVRTLQETLPTRAAQADILRPLTELLAAAQPIVDEYAGGAILSIKLHEDGEKHFTCLYPSTASTNKKCIDLVRKIPAIDRIKSYAGYAWDRDKVIFEPDLANPKLDVGLDENVKARLKEHKIAGLVVFPVHVESSTVAVLKIDFLKRNGIVDNEPTRRLLKMLEEFFALPLRLALDDRKQRTLNASKSTVISGSEVEEEGGRA